MNENCAIFINFFDVQVKCKNDDSKPIIEIIEDDIYSEISYYLPHKKFDNIVFLHGNNVWGYCTACKRYLSNDPSNTTKHFYAMHCTKEEVFHSKLYDIQKFLIDINAPFSIVEKPSFRKVFPNFIKDRKTMALKFENYYILTKNNVRQYLQVALNINLQGVPIGV